MAVAESEIRQDVAPEQVRAVTLRSVGVAVCVIVVSVWWDEWMAYYMDGSNISRSHFPLAFLFPFMAL
ncbi:MAG: hypothetical protein ACO36I_19780, partial [Candidatus Latescibacterota bacterium]